MSTITSLISSGGGGSEINDQKAIYSTANLITTESGEVWLKSGVVSTDTTTYPDATTALTGTTYDSDFSLPQMSAPAGLAFDGTHFHILQNNGYVYKYTLAGVYVSNLQLPSTGSWVTGLTYDGTYFYAGDNTNSIIRRYNSSWVLDTSWSISYSGFNAYHLGLAIVNGVLYALRQNDYCYRFVLTSSGGTANGSFSVAAQTGTATGLLATDGTHLYASNQHQVMFQYTTTGTYTGVSLAVNNYGSNTQSGGAVFESNVIYVTDDQSDKVVKWNKTFSLGMTAADTTLANGTRYVRIK